ncbi:MAG: hypothetical protein Q7K39_04555 [Candidatus Magasanikbacteria bacterium]|nr:hypothetical protein [Candidatus Magasanikbacteria bacterium]
MPRLEIPIIPVPGRTPNGEMERRNRIERGEVDVDTRQQPEIREAPHGRTAEEWRQWQDHIRKHPEDDPNKNPNAERGVAYL